MIVFICIISTSGCSVGIVRPDDPDIFYKRYKNHNVFSDNPRVKIKKRGNKRFSLTINEDFEVISKQDISTLSYNNLYYDILHMIVINAQEYNDKKYCFLIDTGFNYLATTNSLTVEENNLAILPAGTVMGNDIHGGHCFLRDFCFGSTSIDILPCLFVQQHWKVSLLGIPLWQQKGFILGNQLLSKYSFLHFDNPAKKLIFSANKEFIPTNELHWTKYPIFNSNEQHLITTIPIGSQNIDIMFDTCGSHGIVLEKDKWQEIKSDVEIIKEKESSFTSGFYGKLSCKKIQVKELTIAGLTISRPEIIVQNTNNQDKLHNYISMKYFRNSHVVLDYKNMLLWIGKKP